MAVKEEKDYAQRNFDRPDAIMQPPHPCLSPNLVATPYYKPEYA